MNKESQEPEFSGKPTCPKTCGSKSCKGRVKFSDNGDKKCPGIGIGCVGVASKSDWDFSHANEWLKTGHGDRSWFNEKTITNRMSGGHLSSPCQYFVP